MPLISCHRTYSQSFPQEWHRTIQEFQPSLLEYLTLPLLGAFLWVKTGSHRDPAKMCMLPSSDHFTSHWQSWGTVRNVICWALVSPSSFYEKTGLQRLCAFVKDTEKDIGNQERELHFNILFQALNVLISLSLYNLDCMACCHIISTPLLFSPLAALTLESINLALILPGVLAAPMLT